jgi:hypothetical protein
VTVTELSERQQHLGEYMRLSAEADSHLKWMVRDELKDMLPDFEQSEREAAELMQSRYSALQPLEADLAEIRKQIAGAEARVAEERAKLTSKDYDFDTNAYAVDDYRIYSNERDRLYSYRDKLEVEIGPFRAAVEEARTGLVKAKSEREAIELNIKKYPHWGLGFKTSAYRWRADFGHLIPILMAGNSSHPEWDAAWQWMDTLCVKSGYRSEGRIPTNAEQAKQALENWMASNSSTQPAPSMVEIISQGQIHAANLQPQPPNFEHRVPAHAYAKLPGQRE